MVEGGLAKKRLSEPEWYSLPMWDEDDHLGRWVQGFCAVLLSVGALGGLYMTFHATFTMWVFGGIAATLGCMRIAWRCAYYAMTGHNNINRDDY